MMELLYVLELVLRLINTLMKMIIVKHVQVDLYMMTELPLKDVLPILQKEKVLMIIPGTKKNHFNIMYLKIKLMMLKKWLSLFGSNSNSLTPLTSISGLGKVMMLESEDSQLIKVKLLLIYLLMEILAKKRNHSNSQVLVMQKTLYNLILESHLTIIGF